MSKVSDITTQVLLTITGHCRQCGYDYVMELIFSVTIETNRQRIQTWHQQHIMNTLIQKIHKSLIKYATTVK